jgi:hypothetical protein
LESLFKTYIEDNNLEMPSEESIKPLWKVVRKDLKLDPAIVEDDDLRTILTGLAAIVEGTGSLRTHKGSAHGRGGKTTAYQLKPRHARLAAHAAFTLASYIWRRGENATRLVSPMVRQPLGGQKTIKNIDKIADEPVSRILIQAK